MIARLYTSLASLTFGLWLMGGVMALMAAGSFMGERAAALNEMPLFAWLGEAPLAASWWLWGTLCLLALMVVNTILCSIEAIRIRYGKSGPMALLAPQLMHLGFLLIVLAHLLSARGGAKQAMQLFEGSDLRFPGGSSVVVEAIDATMGPRGMPVDFGARVRTVDGGSEARTTVRPNEPLFHRGVGIYVKHVELFPVRTAYVEVHREPGAGWALAGALLFTAGNVLVLSQRRERRTP
ncbi:MAG: cytochrome C biogenesis protein ResB [Desulfuromonadales bacterium]|nr:MAG: cytochrome C biogenesis protein ResB [Desulfuromonadales bacterium]